MGVSCWRGGACMHVIRKLVRDVLRYHSGDLSRRLLVPLLLPVRTYVVHTTNLLFYILLSRCAWLNFVGGCAPTSHFTSTIKNTQSAFFLQVACTICLRASAVRALGVVDAMHVVTPLLGPMRYTKRTRIRFTPEKYRVRETLAPSLTV